MFGVFLLPKNRRLMVVRKSSSPRQAEGSSSGGKAPSAPAATKPRAPSLPPATTVPAAVAAQSTNSLSSSQLMNTSANEKALGSSLPRNSVSPTLPTIRRVGSLTGSVNASPIAMSRPLSSAAGGANVSLGNVSLPPIMSPISVSQGNRVAFTPSAPSVSAGGGAARRASTKKGGARQKTTVAPPPPQPTERDVARISKWWICMRMRLLIRTGAPTRSAMAFMRQQELDKASRITNARLVLETFLLRCASKLRQYVDQKRLLVLCKVSSVIASFVRAKISELKAHRIRAARVQRVSERLLKLWKRSEQYKKREHVTGDRMILDQCCSEEALERREVVRRECIEHLNIRRQHENCITGKWLAQRRAMKELSDDAELEAAAAYDGGSPSSPMSPPATKATEWSSNRRGRRASVRDAGPIMLPLSRAASPMAESSSRRRQSLRKNSLVLQRLSRAGSINLDGLMGGSKSTGGPVSGAALRVRPAFDNTSSPTAGQQANTAGLAFFGNNVDHLESVTASPLLVEFSKRESTSTTRDRALADARLQLLNQQFLYPLRVTGVVSFTSGTSAAVKLKICVSEMFLGDGWGTWFVATSFVDHAAPKKQGSTVHRRSVVVRKRCGGDLLDAQRRLSTANINFGGTRTRSIVGLSSSFVSTSVSESSFARFAARRSSLAQSRHSGGAGITSSMTALAPSLPSEQTPAAVEGAVQTSRGLALRKDSNLFSMDREIERLLIQEHSQRMRVLAQSQRIFEDIAQRIEEERQGDLADLVGPSMERVHDRSVPQKEVFLFGVM